MNLNTHCMLCLLYLFTSSVQAQFYNKDEYLALVAGGERRKDVHLLTSKDPSNFNGYDCSTVLPDLPEVVKGGIALPYKDKDGPPMVCGGVGQGSSEISKTCYLYNKDSNTWGPGPDMVEARFGATAVPLHDGNTWIFGGKWSKKVEMFNAALGKFESGEDMVFHGSVRPCAIYSIFENAIYVLGRSWKSEEDNQLYVFSLNTNSFRFISAMPGKAHAMDCTLNEGQFFYELESTEFVATGGYWRTLKRVQGNAYIHNKNRNEWGSYLGIYDDRPKVMGSASLPSYAIDDGGTFLTFVTHNNLIDGVDMQTKRNTRFFGQYLSSILRENGSSEPELDPSFKIFRYSVPSDIDRDKARKFPAAMWVHPSQVCTKIQED